MISQFYDIAENFRRVPAVQEACFMLINTSFRGLASWLALLPVLVLAVFLSACGGGGGSSATPPDTNVVVKKTGVFLDSIVEGVGYRTSSNISGVTNANGEFEYLEGDQIAFHVGAVTIATATAKDLITVFDLDEEPERVALLLQSLDSDGNPINGINISKEAFEIFNGSTLRMIDVDVDSPVFQNEIKKINENSTIPYSVSDALNHADQTLLKELLKEVNTSLWAYYSGSVDLSLDYNIASLSKSARHRLNLYSFNYEVMPMLRFAEMARRDENDIKINAAKYAQNVVSSFAEAISIGAIVSSPDEIWKNSTKEVVTVAGVTGMHNWLQENGKDKFGLLGAGVADGFVVFLDKTFACIDAEKKMDLLACAASLSDTFISVVLDFKQSYDNNEFADENNSWTLASIYMQEYFQQAGDFDRLYKKYDSSYSPNSDGRSFEEKKIALVELIAKKYNMESVLFGDAYNGAESVLEKNKQIFAQVISNTNRLAAGFGLNLNLSTNSIVPDAQILIDQNSISADFSKKTVNFCYIVKTDSYRNVDLTVGGRVDRAGAYSNQYTDIGQVSVKYNKDQRQCHEWPLNNDFDITVDGISRISVAVYRDADEYDSAIFVEDHLFVNIGDNERLVQEMLAKLSPPQVEIGEASYTNNPGSKVVLQAGAWSINPDFAGAFKWEQVLLDGETPVQLNDPEQTNGYAWFTAPAVDDGKNSKTLKFSVTVRDKNNGTWTAKDAIVKICKAGVDDAKCNNGVDTQENIKPVAKYLAYGVDASTGSVTILPGKELLLSGANSYDQDGKVVSYSWMRSDQLLGTQSDFTFKSDVEGSYAISLKVKDDKGAESIPVTLTVIVTAATPQNQLPTVTLPPVVASNNIITPTVHDENPDKLTYLWSVKWSNQATEESGTGSTYTLNVPALEPGQSATATVSLTVTDDGGLKSVTATQTYTYKIDIIQLLNFDGDDFTDGSVLERGTSKKLTWKVTNAGNVALKNVRLNTSQLADKLTVSDIQPAYIAEWSKGQQQTFTATVTVPNNVTAATHKQRWDITADGKTVNYKTTGAPAYLDFTFKTEDPTPLKGRILFNTDTIAPNTNLIGTVEAYSGNSPYKFVVDWGDGSANSTYTNIVEDTDGYARQGIQHSYKSDGSYHVTVTVSDFAGLSTTFSDDITVASGVRTTQWKVDVHDIDTNTSDADIGFTSTSTTYNNLPLGLYSTGWSEPSGSKEYFVKYRLPVPAGLIQLGRKLRLRSLVKASDIPDHDREFAFKTNTGIEYTASIRDINNSEGGYLRKRDLNTGAVERLVYPIMVDDVKNTKFYGYDIEMGTSDFNIWRMTDNYACLPKDKNAEGNCRLASYDTNVAGSDLSEINITFKGNGQIQLALLEYDRNGDGTYSSDEKLILNTVDKTVDWSAWMESDSKWTSDLVNNKTYYSGEKCDGSAIVRAISLNSDGTGNSYNVVGGSPDDPDYSSWTYEINDGLLYVTEGSSDVKSVTLVSMNTDYLAIHFNSADVDERFYFSQQAALDYANQLPDSQCGNGNGESGVLINNVVNGHVNFLNDSGQSTSVPSDAWVRLVPYRFQSDVENWAAIECKVSSSGNFGASDCYTYNDPSKVITALADGTETFQVVVYKNHINPDAHQWDCGEDTYRYVGGDEANGSWSNIEVRPSNYEDRSNEQCNDNGTTVRMSGHVYDSNGTPVQGATVKTSLDDSTAVTDASGYFDLVTTTARNYATTPYTVYITSSQGNLEKTLVWGDTATGQVFQLGTGAGGDFVTLTTGQGTSVTLTNIITKTMNIYEDSLSGGYVHIPYVKATDQNNKLIFEMSYCANDGGSYECPANSWLSKITNVSTGEVAGGAMGFFNTSDSPKNGYIKGSFSNGEFSGVFEVSNMQVIIAAP